ncbi:hypothetical protein [Rubinisphaera margarita]|uniref:hypothetical protein n=1 Tax=Rubinisphaera margarita TaxID=2909586 RepID=UPI001EE8A38A|nr:hypothetical protein [Rubinisphaera margarita]MCG6156320.1 hypothetical protein [Rubinisphaera margarita]
MKIHHVSLLPGTVPYTQFPDDLVERFQLESKLVYVLPQSLIGHLQRMPPLLLDDAALRAEGQLSQFAEEQSAGAFRCMQPVHYPYLGPSEVEISSAMTEKFAKTDPEGVARDLEKKLSHARRYVQGYLGWLIRQREFWTDLDHLREAKASSSGYERVTPVFSRVSGGEAMSAPPPRIGRERSLCEKWRLQRLESFDLPLPLAPQLTAANPYSRTPPGAIAPFIPDIYPIEGSGETPQALEEIRRSSIQSHLREWSEIIATNSRLKREVKTLARQFQLQHFLRVLKNRYPEQLRRKQDLLNEIFAVEFSVSKATIQRDVSELSFVLKRPLSALF